MEISRQKQKRKRKREGRLEREIGREREELRMRLNFGFELRRIGFRLMKTLRSFGGREDQGFSFVLAKLELPLSHLHSEV